MLYAFFVGVALLPKTQTDDGQEHDGENSEDAADPFRNLVVARHAEGIEDGGQSGLDGVKEDGVCWRVNRQRNPAEQETQSEDDPIPLLFWNRLPVLLEEKTAPCGH